MLSRLGPIALSAMLLADAVLGSTVRADDSPASPQSGGSMTGPGMMGSGDMMGMMNMMTQMTQMMETCNKMMQSAMQHPSDQFQNPGHVPENGG